jgi:hypothetical protein
LFEKFERRLGLISSKEMWPIISFSCLTWCTILRTGRLRNCVSRFWDKFLSANGCSEYFAFEIATSEFRKPNLFNFQSGFRFWSFHITEVVYTVPNRSSVHSICGRPNPRLHVHCIH